MQKLTTLNPSEMAKSVSSTLKGKSRPRRKTLTPQIRPLKFLLFFRFYRNYQSLMQCQINVDRPVRAQITLLKKHDNFIMTQDTGYRSLHHRKFL